MKRKTRTKALSWLLCLAMLLSLVPSMSMTALADGTTWSEDQNITATDTISGGITVTADITLTLGEGVTLTVNGGIDATGHTLTIAGKGTLIVNGTNGNSGNNGNDGDYGGDKGGTGGFGGAGITGNIIVKGATVTITGGAGGAGGNGGEGIKGSIVVQSGMVTVTGGNGGRSGYYSAGDAGDGKPGSGGIAGRAVTGNITGTAEESSNNSAWVAVSGGTSDQQYIKIDMRHTHDFTYAADGATITATCSAENCPLEDSKATLTLKAPENLIADGTAKAATVEGEIPGVDTPAVVYTKDGSAVNAEDVKEEGSYTASITLDDATASIDFAITAPYYTITIPAKLDAAKAGWNETAGISASGAIAEGKKLTVTATSANDWALKNGENTITYYLSDAEDGDATTAWEFTDDELAANTTKPMGAVVEEYINKPAGDYSDTVTFTAEVAAVTKTITIGLSGGEWDNETVQLTYADGDTWKTIIGRNSTSLYQSGNNIRCGGGESDTYNLRLNNVDVLVTAIIDPTLNYRFVCID